MWDAALIEQKFVKKDYKNLELFILGQQKIMRFSFFFQTHGCFFDFHLKFVLQGGRHVPFQTIQLSFRHLDFKIL